jgi:hypothetical protein
MNVAIQRIGKWIGRRKTMSRHHNHETPVQPVTSRSTITAPPSFSNSAPAKSKAVSEDEIRLCAYKKWEHAGRPRGDGVQFWLEAKRELAQPS